MRFMSISPIGNRTHRFWSTSKSELIYHFIYFQRTRVLEAEQWFLRAKKLAPTEPAVYQHFGKLNSNRFV